MQTNETRPPATTDARRRACAAARRRAHSPLLGIAWRLGLGLTAIAAVLVVRRGTGDTHHARRARGGAAHAKRARAAREQRRCRARATGRLRRRGRRFRARRLAAGADISAIAHAGDALEDAVAVYFARRPQPRRVTPATLALRAQLTRHIDDRAPAGRPRRAARAVGRGARGALNHVYDAHRLGRRRGRRHQRHAGVSGAARSRSCRPPSTRCAATSPSPP